MVLILLMTIVTGDYKPTYIWGAPHCSSMIVQVSYFLSTFWGIPFVKNHLPQLISCRYGHLWVITGHFYGIIHSINGVLLLLITGITRAISVQIFAQIIPLMFFLVRRGWEALHHAARRLGSAQRRYLLWIAIAIKARSMSSYRIHYLVYRGF